MVDLVICMGAGKGTWAQAFALIQAESWSRVFILTNPFFSEKIGLRQPHIHTLSIDENKEPSEISEEMRKSLESLSGDVAVNFLSGTGKEHMALLCALLRLGVGIRFVQLTKNGVTEV